MPEKAYPRLHTPQPLSKAALKSVWGKSVAELIALDSFLLPLSSNFACKNHTTSCFMQNYILKLVLFLQSKPISLAVRKVRDPASFLSQVLGNLFLISKNARRLQVC